MALRSYHNHSVFCDGKNTIEEMTCAAIAAGMSAIGFTGHGTYPKDMRYCTKPEDFPAYIEAVTACKEKYADDIQVWLGVENEFYGVEPDFCWDYALGATHYIVKNGVVYFVDNTPELQELAIREGFGGDPYTMTAWYYQTLAQFPEKMQFDIVAHFDLVTKFNEGGRMFDEEDPRYWKPALETMEYLAKAGYAFEINTGAISRGYRTVPYPSKRLLQALHEFGGSVVFGSDSHSVDTVCSGLPEAMELARECGFRTHRVLTQNGWQEVALGE